MPFINKQIRLISAAGCVVPLVPGGSYCYNSSFPSGCDNCTVGERVAVNTTCCIECDDEMIAPSVEVIMCLDGSPRDEFDDGTPTCEIGNTDFNL